MSLKTVYSQLCQGQYSRNSFCAFRKVFQLILDLFTERMNQRSEWGIYVGKRDCKLR